MGGTMYRIGIVGCGGMGRSHAAGWHARSDSEVVATADVSAEAANALAAEYGAHSYTDCQEMLDGEALDIVSITTWQGARAEVTVAAARAGVKAILAEKPMAASWGETLDMMEACEQNGVKLAVGHQRRFDAQNVEVRRLVADGAIGMPTLVIRKDGDGLLNRGTHAIDDTLYWLGDPTPIWVLGQAFRRTDRWERRVRTEDACACIVCFDTGARGIYEGDLPGPNLAEHCVYGSDGTIKMQANRTIQLMNGDRAGWQSITPPAAETDQFQEMIDWIEGRIASHRNAAAVALATMAIMMAVYESVRVQGVVQLPLETRRNALDILVESGRMPVEKAGRYDIRAPFPEETN